MEFHGFRLTRVVFLLVVYFGTFAGTGSWQDGFWALALVAFFWMLVMLLWDSISQQLFQPKQPSTDDMVREDTHNWFLTQQNLHLHEVERNRQDPTRP
jgi:hypothetical protein